MPKAKRLIVGLGNPGAEYEGTRHNIGFAVVDALAAQLELRFEKDRAHALTAWGRWRGRPFGLAKPLSFMNRSGDPVRALLREQGLGPEDLLVVLDDLSLPPGTIRLRQGGSAGGHNGMQHIIDRLGTDAVPRLRVGIGDDYRRGRQADYVLSPVPRDEVPLMEEAVVTAREAALTFVHEGLVTAMNRYNKKVKGE